ncbi:MAG: LamG domain-containing protein, partial [Flammeovirgaceae bacterium]|nr:LamG domain-containing protein [Flammeovirgaceae bacterium]MDW8287388.1 LamG domain-containing protein [Flammeovirgaceae bacterium]
MKCKFLQLLLFFFISYPVFSQPPGNKGLYFNGTTSYLEVSVLNSKSATGGNLSIMGWVKPEENAANSAVISRWRIGDINSNYAIFYEPAHQRFYVTDVDGYLVLTPNNSVPLGEWTHFTMTYQSATKLVEWYINGSLVSSGTLTTGISANNLQPLRIGAIVNPSNVAVNVWKGQLDEIKIFHTTLSSGDIALLMNSTAINSLSMVAYWNFNEGTGSVANDVQVNTTTTHANLLGIPPCTWTLRVTTTNDSG